MAGARYPPMKLPPAPVAPPAPLAAAMPAIVCMSATHLRLCRLEGRVEASASRPTQTPHAPELHRSFVDLDDGGGALVVALLAQRALLRAQPLAVGSLLLLLPVVRLGRDDDDVTNLQRQLG